ncbi:MULTISPECIES: hypothetical protein [Sinorhizobium]|uniref:Uncharacterized protein n=1 Tax=Sinorhizobium americanum TaxID=194963 RepID=A0A2S3YKT0_9HYPH|nr:MULTISPECIES: hypothetical protein [Sinorhizobium]PDT41739.1 hypothetical protein CO656_08690 [Sinorhizobium sp. FG01]POH28553.1 hypothetical protein ATY31_18455 [Sinorhizobium americanum]
MPIPIGTIRNATTLGDDLVQAVRRVLPPAGQRAEAIQKLLDILGRHLSGKEILPREALVRLVEDLARVLKFPPLPQEGGRGFVRRLVEVVESLPLPERQAIERQLGGGSLARRLAALTQSGPSTGFANPTTPLPAGHTGIRNLPLPLSAALHLASAPTPQPHDLALLQAMLRKTYGADDGASAEPVLEEMPQAAETGAPARAEEPPAPAPTPRSTSNGDSAAPAPSAVATEDGREPAEAIEPALAEASENAAASTDDVLPARSEGDDVAAQHRAAELADGGAEQIFGEAEPAGAQAPTRESEGFEADGTYGPTRAKGSDARAPVQAAAPRKIVPESALADAADALLQVSLGLPEGVAEDRRAPASGEGERQAVRTRPAPDLPERLPEAPPPGSAAEDGQPISEPVAAEKPDAALRGSAAVQGQAPAGEDVAMQQAVALLVESGLPEIIPFAMVPYLPAKEEAEDEADRTDRHPADEGEDDGTGKDDREEARRGQDPEGDGDDAVDAEASDAYDLYRKLGDLG